MDMVERYPEGLTPSADAEVRYELRAFVDGEEVYCGVFAGDDEVESEGLRKAAHAVEMALILLEDLER